MKQTLYLETTVPSYLVARPSRDIIVLAHQEITRDWWENQRERFDIYISEIILNEASRGDKNLAQNRLQLLSSFSLLEITSQSEDLANTYIKELNIPKSAIRDAAHIAIASVHRMDYLMTWNCTHIANGEIIKKIVEINHSFEISTPIICTPEELMGGN